MSMTFNKDPSANKPAVFDWSEWLTDKESITSINLTVVGVTLGVNNYTDRKVTAWVSGGSIGSPASVSCRITTNIGRVDTKTIHFIIKQM